MFEYKNIKLIYYSTFGNLYWICFSSCEDKVIMWHKSKCLLHICSFIHMWLEENETEVPTMAVFTWARITFWKTFRIAIQNVIGIVIWTICFPIMIRICALRVQSACADWPMRLCMASARIFKMHTHESRSERALHSHVLESGFLGGSRSKTPLFSRFKSLIWNSFAFTWAKIRLSIQERAESRSDTSFGTWTQPMSWLSG